jgi:integrase
MPRGIPKAKAATRELVKMELDVLVPKGATTFPGTEIPIPKGITIRSLSGVQIEFMYKNVRRYETILGKPTVRHVQAAAEKRGRVLQAIGLNLFNYELEFPDSSSVAATRKTKEDADIKLLKKVETISSALDAWLIIAKPSVGFNAGKDYIKDSKRLNQFSSSVLFFNNASKNIWGNKNLGDIPANELTDIGITCLQSWLLSQPGAKKDTTLSVKRVNNIMTPLRGAMERLELNGTIHRNPFNNVRPLKTKKCTAPKSGKSFEDELDAALPIIDGVSYKESDIIVEPFSPDEVKSILGQLSGSFLNQILFWFWTGLRTGELIALRWSDVDWEGNRIYIRRSVSRGHMKLPKFDKLRWVNLPEPARRALEEQFKLTGHKPGFIFTNPYTKERWANESKIRTRFKKAAENAGVCYRRPYNCRHTYASVMLSSGENPLYVAEQMGHADWSMLIKVYGRWIKGVDVQAGQRVATIHSTQWQTLTELLENGRTVREEPEEDVDTTDELEMMEEEDEF